MLDPHRRPGHLVFLCVRRLEAVAFSAVGVGLRRAAGFAAGFSGFVLAGGAVAAGSGAGSGSSAMGWVAGSAFATAIELDSVRWQVSQVTMVRTSAPS